MEVSRLENTSLNEPTEESTEAVSARSSVTGNRKLPTTAQTAAIKVESI